MVIYQEVPFYLYYILKRGYSWHIPQLHLFAPCNVLAFWTRGPNRGPNTKTNTHKNKLEGTGWSCFQRLSAGMESGSAFPEISILILKAVDQYGLARHLQAVFVCTIEQGLRESLALFLKPRFSNKSWNPNAPVFYVAFPAISLQSVREHPSEAN